MRRRDFMVKTAAAGLGSALLSAQASPDPDHNFVFICLEGGVQNQLLFPIFQAGTTNTLNPNFYWPNSEIITAGQIPLLSSPYSFYPEHPLVKDFGHMMTLINGIDMEGQNDHELAMKIVTCGSPTTQNYMQTLGHLVGRDTSYGMATVGYLPFPNAGGLSAWAEGVEISLKATEAVNSFKSQLDPTGVINQRALDNLAAAYYRTQPHQALMLGNRHQQLQESNQAINNQFRFAAAVGADKKVNLSTGFEIESALLQPYDDLEHILNSFRYHGLAFTASRIKAGGFARVYFVNIGRLVGEFSYDCHDYAEGSVDWHHRFFNTDFKALAIFLEQIKAQLPNTSVFVTSEFSRPPLTAAPAPDQGSEHYPDSNFLMAFSPLLKKEYFNFVSSEYKGRNVNFSDGSSGKLHFAHIYRGMLELLREREMYNAGAAAVDEVMRQYLLVPTIKGLFEV